MHIFKDTHVDFLRWRWHAIALSWVIIIAGVVVFMTKGIPLGIEFAGGTAVIVQFDQPATVQQVRAALDKKSDPAQALQRVAERWRQLVEKRGREKHRIEYRVSLGLLPSE